MSWSNNESLDYSDITEFIKAACDVLNTIDQTDFGLIENGKEVRREVIANAVEIIQKGLEAILDIN